MASHGIARTSRTRTEEQRKQDLEKIARYRDLEDKVRAKVAQHDFHEDTFALTTKLLRANPEYYTIWNVRRRSLISGLLSAPLGGSWPSKGSPSSSATSTGKSSSADYSTSSSITTRPNPDSQTTGQSGTTAERMGGRGGMEDAPQPSEQAKLQQQQAQNSDLEILRSELIFTIPLLLEFPKCYWIWNHRLWTLQQAIRRLQVPVARRIWEEELGLVGKMLTKDRRNFHAWGYRRKVVAQLEDTVLEGKSMVEPEFKYTTSMINVDLSNFSAWHNRSQLIPRLLKERGADEAARKKFLDDELALIRDALNVGPEDQSLWYYHQFLICNLIERDESRTMVPHFTTEERIEYVSREIDDIKEFLEDYHDVKWIYEALLEYTLSKSKIEQREVSQGEKDEIAEWLGKLRKLDPMRNGRWADIAKMLGLE